MPFIYILIYFWIGNAFYIVPNTKETKKVFIEKFPSHLFLLCRGNLHYQFLIYLSKDNLCTYKIIHIYVYFFSFFTQDVAAYHENSSLSSFYHLAIYFAVIPFWLSKNFYSLKYSCLLFHCMNVTIYWPSLLLMDMYTVYNLLRH